MPPGGSSDLAGVRVRVRVSGLVAEVDLGCERVLDDPAPLVVSGEVSPQGVEVAQEAQTVSRPPRHPPLLLPLVMLVVVVVLIQVIMVVGLHFVWFRVLLVFDLIVVECIGIGIGIGIGVGIGVGVGGGFGPRSNAIQEDVLLSESARWVVNVEAPICVLGPLRYPHPL